MKSDSDFRESDKHDVNHIPQAGVHHLNPTLGPTTPQEINLSLTPSFLPSLLLHFTEDYSVEGHGWID